jgi:hypothetical protein
MGNARPVKHRLEVAATRHSLQLRVSSNMLARHKYVGYRLLARHVIENGLRLNPVLFQVNFSTHILHALIVQQQLGSDTMRTVILAVYHDGIGRNLHADGCFLLRSKLHFGNVAKVRRFGKPLTHVVPGRAVLVNYFLCRPIQYRSSFVKVDVLLVELDDE